MMKKLEKISKGCFFLTVLFLSISIASNANSALIIDHTCTDLSQVPEYWINQAKDLFKASYGHTSHGSQIVTGMNMVMDEHGSLYSYDYTSSSCSFNGEFLCDRYPSGDLGNPDRETWAQKTRDLLDNSSNDRNLIIWSWCGQHNTSEENINIYLNLMNQLEADYPDIVFVYMTGHLNSGSGPPDGQTYLRNEQIRQYCQDNNKILFDFADIESWDPDGNDHRDDDDACYWCADWCSTHSCPSCGSCAHSHCFNCYQKGKAFWWMMARLAGWNPGTTTTTGPDTTTTTEGSSTTTTSAGADCLAEEIYGGNSEEVEVLRCFRDSVLSLTPEGREIIRLYYELSSLLVKAINEDEEFEEETQVIIDGILPWIEIGMK
jgi:hypothetical protein